MLLDAPVDSAPRCLGCDGGCCRAFPSIVLSGEEHGRLERLGARRLVFAFPARYWLDIEGGCEFQGADGRCRIYPDRPAICRRFVCVD
ncbi:MAG TPA: YkgJ family cysteine cluster protein [Anaeromyxobacteraceae bacterium]|nr:YkgJ family cysteine cluster protein [Anaeromyxobacteraceae bacterium]